jgi:outer membrane receptor protein involved in Fe transport
VLRRVFGYVWGALFCMTAIIGDAAAQSAVSGTAEDRSGAALVGARVVVMTPQRTVVATATTDKSGKFTISGLPDGQYLVMAQYPSLAPRQVAMRVAGKNPAPLKLILDVAGVGEDVTVTATPGAIQDLAKLSQPVNIINSEEIALRAKTVVAQAVEGESGVNLQRTSPGMAGVFIRGLVGNKVNVFVDGVRYSNGAQRGGVNTFLDLIDPSTLDRIEVLRGPASAQYGSDALGGSLQFLTNVPSLVGSGGSKIGGSIGAGVESGHPGGGGSAHLDYAGSKFGVTGSIGGRKTGNYRPAGGVDSHAAVTRFLGVDSDELYPDRMPDTGFHQVAGHVRGNFLVARNTLLVANYVGSRQDGANRWDQMLGGDGNLIAALNDLSLDLFYARIEQLKAEPFDHLSATYSFNSQYEERINQGGNGSNTATISHEPERTNVHGLQFNAERRMSARQSLLIGGDMYLESLTSVATNVNPVSGAITARRPRVPDGATFRQSGLFAQTTFDVTPKTFAIVAAVRVGFNKYAARAADSPLVNGVPLWPDDELSTTSATFRLGATFVPTSMVTVTAAVSSGYRAPHMTDLGTLGLTGSGFEVAAPDLVGRGAFVGTSAASSAVSSGNAVAQVGPEKSLNFDAGVAVRSGKVRARFGFFVNHIRDNIQKMALILPAGAVGSTLGGQPITAQNSSGTVLVALSSSPVLVRANFDNARIWGIEWTGDFIAAPALTIGSAFTYMRAIDTGTKLPPNIEGGTPAPEGTIWARWSRPRQEKFHWWVQPYVRFAAEQSHLSSLDSTDRRTGAERTRSSIQSFFRNGARNRGWVNSGADGVANNADDILIVTGETLLQVQDRVLGAGVNSSSLWTAVPGYGLVGVRFGLRTGKHTILLDAENLGDQRHRGISWGMDGPGRGITARYLVKF